MARTDSLLIQNARIWDGERFLCGDVRVRDGRIEAVGEHLEPEEVYLTIDADGKLLTPGLIDIHTHLRHISTHKYGIDASMAAIPFGVTAAVDAGAVMGDAALLDRLAIRSAVLVSVHIRDNTAELADIEARAARYGDRLLGLKVCYDTTGADIRDLTPLRQVCACAEAHGWRVMVHCNHSPVPMAALCETLRPGDILTHAYHGDENTAAEDNFASLIAAKARGVIIDAGLAGYVHTDFEVLTRAMAAGATPNTISSDITCLSAYRRGGRYGLTLCMSIFRHLGWSEEEILRAVTSSAAKAVGRDAEWGHILPGRAADLALLEYDTSGASGFDMTDKARHRLADTRGYRALLTVIDGRIVYRT